MILFATEPASLHLALLAIPVLFLWLRRRNK
jgi:hypothetical protein